MDEVDLLDEFVNEVKFGIISSFVEEEEDTNGSQSNEGLEDASNLASESASILL